MLRSLRVGVFALSGLLILPGVAPQDLERISADSLRGHLSFLASDLLQGRATPSPGLDIAAEYIAAQFRRAGLQPGAKDSYFQEANLLEVSRNDEGFQLQIDDGDKTLNIEKERVTGFPRAALSLEKVSIFKLTEANAEHAQAQGGVIAIDSEHKHAVDTALRRLKPSVVLEFQKGPYADEESGTQLSEAALPNTEEPTPTKLTITGADAESLYTKLPAGDTPAKLTLHFSAPVPNPVKARNIVGVLAGSDPALKDSYVLVTAHYDHLGVRESGDGDRIYNGANDDGSGTVSVIEIASALAARPHPKRSIVFIAFFGEERGLVGSRYYGRHPLFALAKTIAQINLEQLGRTDDSNGPEIAAATFTGFGFSDIPKTFETAGKETGVKVHDSKYSDEFFARSDNQALADLGVPAHTIAVAYDFPDYHKVSDEWDKIDYANMAKVDRMIMLGVEMLSDAAGVPRWNASNPKTEKYRKARG